MGYDMRFYVVNKSEVVKADIKGKVYNFGEIVAQYEYCVDYDLANFIEKNSKPTDTYIYINDKETVKDCYGDFMAKIELNDLLSYLHNDKGEYRRKKPFICLLEGFKEEKEKFENLIILKYGH